MAVCSKRPSPSTRCCSRPAIVSISPENFAYVTGFLSPTAPIMRWRHAMAVVTADGGCALVSVDMEANTIRAKSPKATEIAVWREFKFDAMKVLADLLTKRGLAKSRIGMEMDYLPAADLAELATLLPDARFVPAQALLARPADPLGREVLLQR